MLDTVDLVLDPSFLYDAADGDLEFMEGVLREYVTGTEETLLVLRSAIDGLDHQAIYRAAHSVKGASASVGAMRMTTAAGRLEGHASAQAIDEVRQAMGDLEHEFQRLSELVARGEALLVAS
jgi:HPt (histidine-containing phosphotransfer) domain-containing protein